MAWKVTYRDADGKRHSRLFDAENRSALFELLRRQGITPARVEDEKSRRGKDDSNGVMCLIARLLFIKQICDFCEWCKAKFLSMSPVKKSGLIILSATGIGLGIYLGLGWGGGGQPGSGGGGSVHGKDGSRGIEKGRKESRRSNGSTLDGKTGEQPDKGTSVTALPPPPPKKDWLTLQREAMARKLGRKKEHEIVYNESNATDENGRKPIHRNSTEHIMSMIFTTQLGDMPPPLPSVPERDKQRMAQILLDKFEISSEDPDAEEKQAINEVKEALSEHIRHGGDVDEFFSSYHRQLELAHRERTDARNMVLETAKSGDAELAVEMLEKYNQNLESKGIKPITLPQWVIEKKARKQ